MPLKVSIICLKVCWSPSGALRKGDLRDAAETPQRFLVSLGDSPATLPGNSTEPSQRCLRDSPAAVVPAEMSGHDSGVHVGGNDHSALATQTAKDRNSQELVNGRVSGLPPFGAPANGGFLGNP